MYVSGTIVGAAMQSVPGKDVLTCLGLSGSRTEWSGTSLHLLESFAGNGGIGSRAVDATACHVVHVSGYKLQDRVYEGVSRRQWVHGWGSGGVGGDAESDVV